MRWPVVVCGVFAVASARAEGEDPRALFAAGRYAAAAETFQHRWVASGDPVDGVNAVVAWRTAGRYARASVLLARVRSSQRPPSGDAAQTAAALDERLATLTATARLAGAVARDAVIVVDADPPERRGDLLVIDIGDHDIAIHQEGCKPFTVHVTAHAEERLEVPVALDCPRVGTLHLYLAADPDAPFALDGQPHRAAGHEAELALAPGPHALHVALRSRPVLDDTVAIASHETTSLRVRYPWRARAFGWVLGMTGSARVGGVVRGLGLAFTGGVWGSRFRATVDFGSVMSDIATLGPPGHPWFGATGAVHLWTRPLWHGALGPFRLALDADPVAARWDDVRVNSYFGIRAGVEDEVSTFSFLPVALSADGPYVHVEATLWPVSLVHFETAAPRDGVGAFFTILGGWRL